MEQVKGDWGGEFGSRVPGARLPKESEEGFSSFRGHERLYGRQPTEVRSWKCPLAFRSEERREDAVVHERAAGSGEIGKMMAHE